ncbi:MAG TPA: ATP-binding protein [Solirubrobacteraceae bacterium]|jgi:serine/threonine-protein kinase RsbW
MDFEGRAVATAHFAEPATVAAIGTVRRRVIAFAEEHGMAYAQRLPVAAALSEAVTNAVRHAYPAHETGDVVVDVATDGESLTVRVADRGPGGETARPGLGVQLMTKLADRLELAAGGDGIGTVALMEFAMGVEEPHAAPRGR